MNVQGVLETAIYVDDLETAMTFYRDIIGLEVFASEIPRHVFFRCGIAMLLLFNPEEALKNGSVPVHGARGPQHVCFRVTGAELDQWLEHLQRHEIGIELDLRWPNGGRSLYFRDPAGNSVELASAILWGISEAVSIP